MIVFEEFLKIYLVNSCDFYFLALSELPAFLVDQGGLNSGFMIAHCTAAALGKNTLIHNVQVLHASKTRLKTPLSHEVVCF